MELKCVLLVFLFGFIGISMKGKLTMRERIIQEYVPGKQVTMAHLIANPTSDSYLKLGIEKPHGAIGILTITPSEAAIIAVDMALKAGDVDVSFVDRFSGTVILTGHIASVEAALLAVVTDLKEILGFASTTVTKS